MDIIWERQFLKMDKGDFGNILNACPPKHFIWKNSISFWKKCVDWDFLNLSKIFFIQLFFAQTYFLSMSEDEIELNFLFR